MAGMRMWVVAGPVWLGLGGLFGFVGLGNGEANGEGSAVAGLAGGGDGAGVAVGDAAADGEANACAFVFAAAVEALEHGKDFVGVFGIEANAVVLDGEFDHLGGGHCMATRVGVDVDGGKGCVDELGGNVDFGGMGRARGRSRIRRIGDVRRAVSRGCVSGLTSAATGLEFEGVGDDVLEELAHLHGVGVDGGEVADVDFSACLLDAQFEVAQDFTGDGSKVDGDEGLCGADDAGEGEEVVDECLHAGGGVLHALHVVFGTGVQGTSLSLTLTELAFVLRRGFARSPRERGSTGGIG